MNISTLVGLYNNLEYTKYFYSSFREIYPTEELVFVSYGSSDGTFEWLVSLILDVSDNRDKNVICFFYDERKTFSDTYNKAIELATKEYVVFMHNDIVVAPGFLENLDKHLHPQNVVSYTTIEPPIFPDHERPGKIVRDFGSDLETFKIGDAKSFIKGTVIHYKDQTNEGVSFFMALSRQVLLNMGGFDNLFNPYHFEDIDLIRRLKAQNLNCFTSLDSIVYHFVSKTSRFSEEAKKNTYEIETNSDRNYKRKWGSYNSNNRFDIGFIVKNADYNTIHHLEPWCNNFYTDSPDVEGYIENNKSKTKFNLQQKFSKEEINDITISFDAHKLTQNNFEIIQNMNDILEDASPNEEYEIDIFKIKVNKKINYLKNLIFIPKQK
jgi:GT2 family glycosyltransferase